MGMLGFFFFARVVCWFCLDVGLFSGIFKIVCFVFCVVLDFFRDCFWLAEILEFSNEWFWLLQSLC